MGNTFLDFMKQIGIFIICAQSIMHFAAGKSYEKYIKLLIGIIILAQFIVPIRGLFLGSEKAQLWDEIDAFQGELASMEEEMEYTFKETEITDFLNEDIKEKLSKTAAEYGYEIKSAEVEEEPPMLFISVEEGNPPAGNKKENSLSIEKINIDINNENKMTEEVNEVYGKEMKKKFSVSLGIEEEYIIISK